MGTRFAVDGMDEPIADELARAFAELAVASPRAMIAHYPRPELPGKCFALVVAFHTMPDPNVVEEQMKFERYMLELRDLGRADGLIFEIRQVWQTEGGEPRLIEATVDYTNRFFSVRQRHLGGSYFGDEQCGLITCDSTRGGHFAMYGGGHRRGLLWCDRSFGLGEPDPYSIAYRVEPGREIRVGLSPELIAVLREFVTRF